MNKNIKVGDRVSAKQFNGIESLGTVIYVGYPYVDDEEQKQHFDVLVKFDTWRRGHDGDIYYRKYNLDYDEEDRSHWWFNNDELVVVGKDNE